MHHNGFQSVEPLLIYTKFVPVPQIVGVLRQQIRSGLSVNPSFHHGDQTILNPFHKNNATDGYFATYKPQFIIYTRVKESIHASVQKEVYQFSN